MKDFTGTCGWCGNEIDNRDSYCDLVCESHAKEQSTFDKRYSKEKMPTFDAVYSGRGLPTWDDITTGKARVMSPAERNQQKARVFAANQTYEQSMKTIHERTAFSQPIKE